MIRIGVNVSSGTCSPGQFETKGRKTVVVVVLVVMVVVMVVVVLVLVVLIVVS